MEVKHLAREEETLPSCLIEASEIRAADWPRKPNRPF